MFKKTAYAAAITLGLARLLAGCGNEADWTENLGVLTLPASPAGSIRAAGGNGQMCLDVKDASRNEGTLIQLWTCHDGDNQQFTATGSDVRVFGDKCLSVAGARDRDGTSVRIKQCDASKRSQHWERDGSALKWKGTDKCLDVSDGEFRDGTLMQIWTCAPGSQNQAFAFAGGSASPSKPAAAPVVARGTRLDLSKWHQETYAPRTFNNEQQRYTDGNRNVSFAADGTTTITARKVNGEWQSARLSGDEVGSLPAYYEATITLPRGRGTWPAFWLTARGSWPQGGEIDIMEQVNGDGQTHWSNHWGPTSGRTTFDTHENIGGLDLSQPHRYGGLITKDGVQFYLDGKKVGKWVTYPAQSDFPRIASQMVPIVNLAMGGMWPGDVPGDTGTQVMVVHSVTRSNSAP